MSRPSSLILIAALVFSFSFAARAAAQDSEAPRRTTRHHLDHGLVSAGVATLCVGWSLNVLGSLAAESSLSASFQGGRYGTSLIPVVGPLVWGSLVLDQRDDRSGSETTFAAFAFVDAAVQGVGLGLLIAGLLGVDDEVTVFEPIAGVSIVPVAGGGFTGLMLDARF